MTVQNPSETALGCVHRIEHETDTRARASLSRKRQRDGAHPGPYCRGIDSTFFGKASHKEQKSLVQILAKLTAGTTDE
ncbi:MAG: hypothetical protein U1E78_13690 [Gammaproteobacteria bacterium]